MEMGLMESTEMMFYILGRRCVLTRLHVDRFVSPISQVQWRIEGDQRLRRNARMHE